MTATRIVVRGATTAITRRTTLRKAFLAPWHPLVEQCWLYALADAQRVLNFEVHHAVRVITHHHLTITPSEPNLGEITRRFHRDVSCAINTLLAHESYDAPRNIFDGRTAHCMRLLDAEAQASHLTYEYLNPVAAGLVARPEDMPGTVLSWAHWKSGGVVVRRPYVYFGKSRPEELLLRLGPAALLMRDFDGDLEALRYHMQRMSDEGIRALRDARRREPLGAQKLQRLHPWMEPKTLAEPGGRLVPSFKIGARGLAGRRMAGEVASEARGFRQEHESCRQQWRKGERAISFPHGTYAMRVFHGAAVSEPLPDAILAQPGPLLDEVLEELRGARGAKDYAAQKTAQRTQVVQETKTAWREEAAEVVDLEHLDFSAALDGAHQSAPRERDAAPPRDPDPGAEPRRSESEPQPGASDTDPGAPEPPETAPRPEPRVRHRFDRDLDRGARHPRRLITLRDRRRRPRKPRGSDPPV